MFLSPTEDDPLFIFRDDSFVGVDLILGDSPDDDRVIELNPRLTLSYVALSGMCATNLADLMLDPDALVSWSDRTVRFDADGTLTGN